MVRSHPIEVMQALVQSPPIGTTVKVQHEYTTDGKVCSLHKSAAMAVTRNSEGAYYFCHRCALSGHVRNHELPPDLLAKFAQGIKDDWKEVEPVKPRTSKHQEVNLGLIPIIHDKTPKEVKLFMDSLHFEQYVWGVHDVMYSTELDRVVFPCKSQGRDTKGDAIYEQVIGIAARCYKNLSKGERAKMHRPKWITRKLINTTDRIYYRATKKYSNPDKLPIVIVEDPFSALAVYTKTGAYNGLDSVALLGNKLSYNLLLNHRDTPFILWLDADMRAEQKAAVKRFRSLGFNITDVESQLDPKEYSKATMQMKIKEACARVGHDYKIKHY